MIFQGIFKRINNSHGSIISSAETLEEMKERVIFDATYCSPWSPEDVTVLRIDNYDTNEILYAHNDEWHNKDIKQIFG